jgi:hypothetical protein
VETLEAEIRGGQREEYLKVLEKVPDIEPEDYDRI